MKKKICGFIFRKFRQIEYIFFVKIREIRRTDIFIYTESRFHVIFGRSKILIQNHYLRLSRSTVVVDAVAAVVPELIEDETQ